MCRNVWALRSVKLKLRGKNAAWICNYLLLWYAEVFWTLRCDGKNATVTQETTRNKKGGLTRDFELTVQSFLVTFSSAVPFWWRWLPMQFDLSFFLNNMTVAVDGFYFCLGWLVFCFCEVWPYAYELQRARSHWISRLPLCAMIMYIWCDHMHIHMPKNCKEGELSHVAVTQIAEGTQRQL